jgi:hypothetical protein
MNVALRLVPGGEATFNKLGVKLRQSLEKEKADLQKAFQAQENAQKRGAAELQAAAKERDNAEGNLTRLTGQLDEERQTYVGLVNARDIAGPQARENARLNRLATVQEAGTRLIERKRVVDTELPAAAEQIANYISRGGPPSAGFNQVAQKFDELIRENGVLQSGILKKLDQLIQQTQVHQQQFKNVQ